MVFQLISTVSHLPRYLDFAHRPPPPTSLLILHPHGPLSEIFEIEIYLVFLQVLAIRILPSKCLVEASNSPHNLVRFPFDWEPYVIFAILRPRSGINLQRRDPSIPPMASDARQVLAFVETGQCDTQDMAQAARSWQSTSIQWLWILPIGQTSDCEGGRRLNVGIRRLGP